MILQKISIDDLLKQVHGRKIICFGGGKVLESFCNQLMEYNFEYYVEYIVDNDKNKWGLSKKCKGRSIKIISPGKMCDEFSEKFLLIITCVDLEGILKQLNSYQALNKYNCYFYYSILATYFYKKALNAKTLNSLRFFDTPKIPKIIHYCWFGKNKLPDKYKGWMQSWKKYCSDYEIIEWNEGNYDISKNRYMKEAYDAKKWGFVSDYARLDIIYEKGGIYLDTDVELIKGLDELLYQYGFCGFQDDFRVATGLGFGAIPHFPMIRKMRDMYNSINFVKKDGTLNLKPCTYYQTQFLKYQGLIENGEFQQIENMNIYPATYFCGIMGSSRKRIITDNTFSLHHFDGSWVDIEKKEKSRMIREL